MMTEMMGGLRNDTKATIMVEWIHICGNSKN